MKIRWSVIAANLQGRTDNDVKNHWNTKLKKKLLASQNNTNLITTSSYNFTNINITSSDHDFNDHKFSRNNYYGTLDYYSNTFTSHMDPNSTNYSTCQFPLPALMEIQANDGATIQEDGYNFMDFSSGISSSSSSSYYDDRVVQCKEHSTLVGFGKRSHPRIARCTEHPASAGSREELYPKVAQCTEYFASTEFEKRSHTKECDVYYDDILGNEFDFQENDIGSYYNILEIDQLLKGFDQN
ncbi:hypothetical protein HAX54_027856 [Datura stramonium]|uniref:Uncharacterized protein n=1 Tax=Datura stramonium TaxID=4076 RepID=A0ABS8S931_DATST|nr:hypothetical protein [Datura stramonium]